MDKVVKIENYIKNARELEVYKLAYATSLEIHKKTMEFPQAEQFALTSQIRRASKSICANLSEGFAKQKQSAAEFKRFIWIALGSSAEMQTWLDYAYDLGYIDAHKRQEWSEEYDKIAKMLQTLHNKIK